MGRFDEQGAFYRGGAPFMPWMPWYLLMGRRDFPKFPAAIGDENRDRMAEEAVERSWMEPNIEGFTGPTVAKALAHLPLTETVRRHGGQQGTDFDEFVRRQPRDPAWNTTPLFREGDVIDTPTLWVFQTHDLAIGPNLAAFEYVLAKGSTRRVRDAQHLLISALGHCSTGRERADSLDGQRAIGDPRLADPELFTKWFDHWLKAADDEIAKLPRAQVYVPGRNAWQTFAGWPATKSLRTFHLDSRGSANSRNGDGALRTRGPKAVAKDTFVYDPMRPVPTVGGDACCLADAPDTDFAVNLVAVAPDGTAYILAGSIQRARWRNGYDTPQFMEPGRVYKVTVGPFYVSNRFLPGHRVRLDVTSSNFPRWDRNLNTGGNNFDESSGRLARNAVHHGGVHRSTVALPVVELH